jgi:tetratricopeptide (TPR) repeat protein
LGGIGLAGESVTCVRRALDHFKLARAGDNLQADAIHLEGHGHELNGDHASAIKCFRAAFELNEHSWPLNVGILTDMTCWASSEEEAGDLASAGERLRKALGMAEMIHNKPVAASLKSFLASLTLTQKDFAGAEIYCREALPEYETVKNLPGIAELQMKLAKPLSVKDARQRRSHTLAVLWRFVRSLIQIVSEMRLLPSTNAKSNPPKKLHGPCTPAV